MNYHHSKSDASSLCPVRGVPVPERRAWTSLDRPGFYNTCSACAEDDVRPQITTKNDLLLRLLDAYIVKGKAPDVLSREHVAEGEAVIRFEWFTGIFKDFPYSKERYGTVWDRFHDYWAKEG